MPIISSESIERLGRGGHLGQESGCLALACSERLSSASFRAAHILVRFLGSMRISRPSGAKTRGHGRQPTQGRRCGRAVVFDVDNPNGRRSRAARRLLAGPDPGLADGGAYATPRGNKIGRARPRRSSRPLAERIIWSVSRVPIPGLRSAASSASPQSLRQARPARSLRPLSSSVIIPAGHLRRPDDGPMLVPNRRDRE